MDRTGKITMAELDAMQRMLCASPDADPELLELLAVNGRADEDALSFEEFLQVGPGWGGGGGSFACGLALPPSLTPLV